MKNSLINIWSLNASTTAYCKHSDRSHRSILRMYASNELLLLICVAPTALKIDFHFELNQASLRRYSRRDRWTEWQIGIMTSNGQSSPKQVTTEKSSTISSCLSFTCLFHCKNKSHTRTTCNRKMPIEY